MLGTCKRTAGQTVARGSVHRGLADWKFGGIAAEVSVDAQVEATWQVARLLSPHFKQQVHLHQFPSGTAPVETLQYLDLDETRPEAAKALIEQAQSDANETMSRCADDSDNTGISIRALFHAMPLLPNNDSI